MKYLRLLPFMLVLPNPKNAGNILAILRKSMFLFSIDGIPGIFRRIRNRIILIQHLYKSKKLQNIIRNISPEELKAPKIDNSSNLISIIILTHNKVKFTKLCIESILAHTLYSNYEIIIVENASKDETPQYLSSLRSKHVNIKVLMNPENLGFAAGNNQGVKLAQGDYFVFLNNDVIVTKSWLIRLLSHLQKPGIGLVGAVTNQSGNESKIPVGYESNDLENLHKFAHYYVSRHKYEIFDIGTVGFYCAAIKRSTFNEAGPLDEQFGLGNFEDDDYATRIRNLGLRVVCAEDVFVHHFGSATFSALNCLEFQKLFIFNKKLFEKKWKTRWLPPKFRWGQ